MKTGIKGINLIKKFESLHDGDLKIIGLQPKMCPAGIWTEGYGRAMRDDKGNFIKWNKNKELAYSRISINNEEEAYNCLVQDLLVYEKIVLLKIKVALSQNQFDALVSHTYNTGGSLTLFNHINNKMRKEIIQDWFVSKYISISGENNGKDDNKNGIIDEVGERETLKGLVLRRKEESELFFTI